MIAIAIIVGVFSYVGHNYYITKWQKELGTYVDRKRIRWCKTCAHFSKVGKYENELWQSEEMIEDAEIPCKILNDTKLVWTEYFNAEVGKRTWYPKNCEKWTAK